MMDNTVVWFDIPVTDLDRATNFYAAVMQVELLPFHSEHAKMSFFPHEPGVVSGALVQSEQSTPSTSGTVVYLNGGEDLAGPLERVEAAGGQVLQAKMPIGEHGFIAYFLDTEGNKVALHSMG
jgi:uncharacterized protein